MVAWHQRDARFALRYQTHLTVVRLIGISRVCLLLCEFLVGL